jgi:DNA modification methylase
LRDYSTGHPAELGSEPHWRDFIQALILATAEMVRVLKPSGSIFINLGDRYAGGGQGGHTGALDQSDEYRATRASGYAHQKTLGIRDKSLMLLPERYRIACVDQLGLVARAVIIWNKPNGLPESVRDRVRRSHEDWVHLTRGPRYYAALDEIREPYEPVRGGRNLNGNKITEAVDDGWFRSGPPNSGLGGIRPPENPLGKLPGSVWTIPSEPLRLPPWIDTAHYAAFGVEFPRRFILAFTPPGHCVVCKVGRFPVVQRELTDVSTSTRTRIAQQGGRTRSNNGRATTGVPMPMGSTEATILGYACGCTPHTDHPATIQHADGTVTPIDPDLFSWIDAQSVQFDEDDDEDELDPGEPRLRPPWREYHLAGWTPPPTTPATVLDPFGGTGCSAHVARALGRIGISIDLSEAYCRVAADRTLARQRASKVLGKVHLERQGTLL